MSMRKILIPVVAGLFFSPALMAAIVDDVDLGGPSTTAFFSDELLQTAVAASAVAAGDLAVTLEAEYAVGDVINWAVSGSAVDSGFPTTVIFDCTAETAMGLSDGEAGITFGLLSDDADGASYRVTGLDTAGCVGATSTFGNTVLFAADDPLTAPAIEGIVLDAQSVAAAGTVNAAYSAQTSTGLGLDTGGGTSRNVEIGRAHV